MLHISPREIRLFQTKILSWYEKHKRDLPWREMPDGISLWDRAYRILISEVMLQQTQVSRVIPKYEAWLQTFPTVEALANASVSDVLERWMGLGYNRRALFLKKTAEAVSKRGSWPQTETELLKLPGVGTYTARALLCFAFGKEVSVVDTNVRKVILVEFGNKEDNCHCEDPPQPETKQSDRMLKQARPPDSQSVVVRVQHDSKKDCHASLAMTDNEIQRIADDFLPTGKAYVWNQALMDYAQVMLKDKKIPVPKQSRYLGSDRYYRAKILKLLLVRKELSIKRLGLLLRDDFTNDYDHWLETILAKMVKDGLILREKHTIRIA